MGAEYRADWTSDCTLLVCAFVNTPKFRQVQADNGTIVSKDWIFESYKQKKLVDIEPFLMHAGKPWRKNKEPVETDQDEKETRKVHQKQVQRSRVKPSTSDATEAGNLESANKCFSPSKIKQWAVDDLAQTMSWLDSLEEKPEPSELKTIASEGVITCLQDAIESLEQGNDIKGVAEQWSFVPHVVNELLELDGGGKGAALPKEQLCQLAAKCKKIYQAEFARVVDIDGKNKDKHQNDSPVAEHRRKTKSEDDHYDSDETIEMTEEEIDFACRQLPGLCG
ncbi:DNA-repair protein XRCC1-like [Miscanthus floridulus]|uniref:DNA-repair protein XRCC1-like n=1 Tax=Miscanthus floridulus TaxID=154761 RepID=UPI00345ADC6B